MHAVAPHLKSAGNRWEKFMKKILHNAMEEIARKAYWNSSFFGETFAALKNAKLW